MGVARLLSFAKPLIRPRNLRDYSGCIVGIDGNIWLHRSINGYTKSTIDEQMVSNETLVRYFIRRTRSLLESGVYPMFVFDGAELPAKSQTHIFRSSVRTADLAREIALLESNGAVLQTIHSRKSKKVNVDHALIHCIVHALKLLGVSACISPYEADAQLTRLAITGIVDTVITEDSDLLVYGCPKVIFKFDPSTGIGLEVGQSILNAPEMAGLSTLAMQFAAVLAGCDYFPGIPGIGLKKAVEIARACEPALCDDNSLLPTLTRVLNDRRNKSSLTIDQWFSSMRVARLVFQHQTVYNTDMHRLEPLSQMRSDDITSKELHLLGPLYDNGYAQDMYAGKINPSTGGEHSTDYDLVGSIVDSELLRPSHHTPRIVRNAQILSTSNRYFI